MTILENKQFHGLPGLGATGKRGDQGTEGLNVLFGYIEDFFDQETVVIDEFVRYASIGSGEDIEYFEDKIGQFIFDYQIYLAKGEVFDSPTSSHISETIKLGTTSEQISIPTTFSREKANVGDIIYIIEDDHNTGSRKIRYMIVVEESMYGKPFNTILENYILLVDPTIITSFYEQGDRLLVSEMYSPLRYEVPALLPSATKQKYIKNFIKDCADREWVKIVSEFDKGDGSFLESANIPDSSMFIEFGNNAFSQKSNSKIKANSFFLNNTCLSNVELSEVVLPKEIMFTNKNYLKSISENDFDSQSGSIKILFSRFFDSVDSIVGYSYGVLVSKITEGINEVLDYNFGNSSVSYLDILNISEEGENKFKLILYIRKNGTSTYYSRPSVLTVNKKYLEKFDQYIIESYGVEDGDSAMTDDVDSGDTEYIDFTLDALNAEANEDVKFCIQRREGFYIDSISFNSIPVFLNDKDDLSGFADTEGYWMSITGVDADVNEGMTSSKVYTLSFRDNLPNLNLGSENPKTIEEYLKVFGSEDPDAQESLLFAQNNNVSTLPRSILVTVVTKKSKDDPKPKKSFYKIIQPGFTDTRMKPSFEIKSRIYNNELEKSNNVANGVLCNQFQFFTDIVINDFNENTWAKYKKDTKVDLHFIINRLNEEKTNYIGSLVNNPGIFFYEPNLLDSLKNNAFRIKAEYIKDPSISIESTEDQILESEGVIEIGFDLYSGEEKMEETSVQIDDSVYASDWIYLNNLNSPQYSIFFKDDQGIIKDIPFAKAGDKINHKLRIIVEFANPLPAELNINISLSKAVMHYNIDGKEIYFPANYYSLFEGATYSYNKYEYESGNHKFIFNPLYFTAAPTADENLVSLSFKPALKKCTGSIKETTLGFGLYGYDEILTYANRESEYDKLTKPYKYSDFFIKVKDFQDNIKSIYLSPIDIKDSSFNNSVPKGNVFKSFIELIKSQEAKSKGYETFEDDERVNKFNDNAYLSLVYNGNIMMPKYEAEKSIITYNDKEYDGANYSQFENNVPVFLKEGFNLQIRSDEELAAISGWNFEYENSESFKKDYTIGGSVTISGNGYLNLPSGYGKDLYNEEEIIPLDELVKEQSQEVFSSQKYLDSLQYSSISSEFIPKDGNYWRVPIWNLSWMLPIYKYNKVSNQNYIIPYRFTNPYMMFLDYIVTDNLIKEKDYGYIVSNLGIITGSYQMSEYIKDFLDTDGHAIVINAKYNNYSCIKLLDILNKTDYTAASIDDQDVSNIVDKINETSDKYEEQTKEYAQASDVPNNIIRWWKCSEALKVAQENPTEYDTNLSELEVENFTKELLDIAYSDDQISEDENKKFNLEYYEKYTKKENGVTSMNNFIPYNLLYTVYPRIIYPQDKDRINVLMVQQPTICSATNYKLNKHYFSTINYTDIYPDLPEPYQCLL